MKSDGNAGTPTPGLAQAFDCKKAPLPSLLDAAEGKFHRDGYLLLPGFLDPSLVSMLLEQCRAATERVMIGDSKRILRSQMHLQSPILQELIDPSPVIEIADRLLSTPRLGHLEPCVLLNIAAMTIRPGYRTQEWHVDGALFQPRPEGVPWDSRIPFPPRVITVMYYLSDNRVEESSTELVPGSHRSGRMPEQEAESLEYEGRGSALVRPVAGDALLFDSQIWHRARGNQGTRTRHLLQVHYACAFMARTLFPYPNHHTPTDFLGRLNPRQLRLMGMKPLWTPYS